MRITLSHIKADIGGFVGHSGSHILQGGGMGISLNGIKVLELAVSAEPSKAKGAWNGTKEAPICAELDAGVETPGLSGKQKTGAEEVDEGEEQEIESDDTEDHPRPWTASYHQFDFPVASICGDA